MLGEAEKNYLSKISIDDAWSHVEYLSTLDKTSGTEGETRTLLDTVFDGGVVGLIIILLSMVSVGFIVEHFLTIRI